MSATKKPPVSLSRTRAQCSSGKESPPKKKLTTDLVLRRFFLGLAAAAATTVWSMPRLSLRWQPTSLARAWASTKFHGVRWGREGASNHFLVLVVTRERERERLRVNVD